MQPVINRQTKTRPQITTQSAIIKHGLLHPLTPITNAQQYQSHKDISVDQAVIITVETSTDQFVHAKHICVDYSTNDIKLLHPIVQDTHEPILPRAELLFVSAKVLKAKELYQTLRIK